MPNRRKKSSAPIRLMIITGMFVVFFSVFLVYLSGVKPDIPVRSNSDQANPVTADTNTTGEAAQAQDFEFYELLQQPSVKKPSNKTTASTTQGVLESPKTTTEKTVTPQPVNANTQYVLQVGSFKRQADADALRAQMILMGFSTQIRPTRLDNGELWYRTVIGPIAATELSKTRQQLSEIKIEPLTLKIP